MKAGQFEGAQYLVPVTYSLGLMYTTEERLAAYGIEYEEGMTLAEFAAQLPEFYENNPNTKIFPTYLTSYFLCTQNAMDLIDHENGTIKNDAESLAALEAMSEAFDGLFPNIYGDAAQYMTYRDHKGKTDAQMYREEALLFASARSFTGNYECINIITNALYMEDVMQGETPLLIHLPTIDGGAPAPVMTYYLMANANTENKYAVREFIEYAVGDENQIMLSGCGIPVNYDAQAFYEEWFGNENSKIGEKYGLWKAGTPDEEFVEAYFELIDNMRDPIWNDYAVLDGMTAVIRAYSWDRLPMDEALASQTEELEALIAK